jgi:methionyl-tRNA synthetase
MCVKYFDGRLEGAAAIDLSRWRQGLDLTELATDLRAKLAAFEYSAVLQRIWRDVIDPANRYIQETEPFKLAKTNPNECRAVLINLADWLRITAILIKPFLPRTAETFYRAFDFESLEAWQTVNFDNLLAPVKRGELHVTAPITGGKPAPLFPKIEAR